MTRGMIAAALALAGCAYDKDFAAIDAADVAERRSVFVRGTDGGSVRLDRPYRVEGAVCGYVETACVCVRDEEIAEVGVYENGRFDPEKTASNAAAVVIFAPITVVSWTTIGVYELFDDDDRDPATCPAPRP